VSTSETPRFLTFYKQIIDKNYKIMSHLELYRSEKKQTCLSDGELAWNQWLAGIIDGDGYLAIQKSNKVAVCEITMPLEDESLLFAIKQKLGGSITLRSGAKAVRYRLCHQSGMINLIHRVNGCIRNTVRVLQFQTLCNHFNIRYLVAEPLTLENGYLAGFFDADGTIYIGVTKATQPDSILPGANGKITRLANSQGNNQLVISISNKSIENLIGFQKAFGSGSIRAVKHRKRFLNHIYTITNIDTFLNYISKYPLYSEKRKKVFLVPHYFELKRLKAHLAVSPSLKLKAWKRFCKKWYN
jgi:ubiquinol-cytochrome c reductase cytochrome b subunit